MGRMECGRAVAALLPLGGTLISGTCPCALRMDPKMGGVA